MEECESLESEVTELQECQSEASEAISQDDEDEVELLKNRFLTHWSSLASRITSNVAHFSLSGVFSARISLHEILNGV